MKLQGSARFGTLLLLQPHFTPLFMLFLSVLFKSHKSSLRPLDFFVKGISYLFFLLLILERGEEKEKEGKNHPREKHRPIRCLNQLPLAGALTCVGSNPPPFSLQDTSWPTEPHQPAQDVSYLEGSAWTPNVFQMPTTPPQKSLPQSP